MEIVTVVEGTELTVSEVLTASPWRRSGRRFIRQPAGVIGLTIFTIFVVTAVFPSLLAPHDPFMTYAGQALKSPNRRFPLGTDSIGRDVLSRVIYGARPALITGSVAAAIGGTVGALSGFAAGFYDNRTWNAVMRIWDGVFAIPVVLIGLILAATFGNGLTVVVIAVGIAAAPTLARVARAATLAESQLGYVEAAEALGYRKGRIFWRHVVPNSLSAVVVQLALTMAFAILLESALAFLGVSTQPPAASWGVMLSDSRNYLSQAWWYGLFPGLAITLLVLAINLIADAARDALDPRAEQGQ